MGCDGGTIPTRGELVKEKKRDVKLDPKIGLDAKVSLDPRTLSLGLRNLLDLRQQWKTCKLSSAPLKEPVVACELGRLYNKVRPNMHTSARWLSQCLHP